MKLFGVTQVFAFFPDVFSERSPVETMRNLEYHFDAFLINDHSASTACNLIGIVGRLVAHTQEQLNHGWLTKSPER